MGLSQVQMFRGNTVPHMAAAVKLCRRAAGLRRQAGHAAAEQSIQESSAWSAAVKSRKKAGHAAAERSTKESSALSAAQGGRPERRFISAINADGVRRTRRDRPDSARSAGICLTRGTLFSEDIRLMGISQNKYVQQIAGQRLCPAICVSGAGPHMEISCGRGMRIAERCYVHDLQGSEP